MADFGLLGERLGHSFSPYLHKALGDYDYGLFEVAPEGLEDFMSHGNFKGINVTIPYKKAVIPYCDALSQCAAGIGSVNTIVRRDGKLYGDNTDYFGFIATVIKYGIEVSGKKALILGNGGVAPTIREALSMLGAAEIITVSRSGNNNYVNLYKHFDAEIIVNATPVGMYPNNGESLVKLADFPRLSGVIDVVYNPLRTKLICEAEKLGIPCCGGLYMLVAQAAKACELFTGNAVPAEEIDRVFISCTRQKQNIILIGMPGCGKSSCAIELCKLIDAELIDIDEEIVKRIGCSIPEFFAKHGEAEFRRVETEVLRECTKKSGAVIATGGGVVTRNENYELLHQNGVIIWLRRDFSSLPTEGRPISLSLPLELLYSQRAPLYESWCDFTVTGNSPADTAQKILEVLG